MACCLTAPSHYLNQCWFIISKVLSFIGGHYHEKIWRYQSVNKIENYISRIAFRSPGVQWVKPILVMCSPNFHNIHTRHAIDYLLGVSYLVMFYITIATSYANCFITDHAMRPGIYRWPFNNSSALGMELLQSYAKPSIYQHINKISEDALPCTRSNNWQKMTDCKECTIQMLLGIMELNTT